jgi:N-acetylglucosamine-6-phosphate deacetylase
VTVGTAVVEGRDADGRAVALTLSEGVIQSVEAAAPASTAAGGPWLLPGFIDIQVNGFGGYDLNREGVTVEDVAGVVRALWTCGVTRFCPTICTESRERMIAALETIARACEEIPWVARAVVGVHVEGPFISPEDGPRGAHPRRHVRPPSWDEFQAFQEAARGRICMMTLAPELPGAIEFIERLLGGGIIPAIGHTGAGRVELRAAAQAGARISTHLGNGSHAMIPRHHNYIWEQLALDDLWASLIVDGHHLPPAVVKVFVRAKEPRRCILTSDAVWLAGLTPGTYDMLDSTVELTAERKVQLVGTPYLAGSAIDLAAAVGNAVAFAGVGLDQAVQMASRQPARLLQRPDLGALTPRSSADLVLASWDADPARLDVVQTIVAGEVVYRA